MKYVIDNDMHVHTHLSICSRDKEQTPENILKIAKERGLKTVCITDHYWDEALPVNTKYNWWYEKQNYPYIAQSLPLPKDEEVKMLFGCEADLDSSYNVGISPNRFNDFDFIIVSTTHFNHMTGEEWENCTDKQLADFWVKRLEAVLSADLPFKKVGIAHLACPLVKQGDRQGYLKVLDIISNEDMVRLFTKASKLGIGIELNYCDIRCEDQEVDTVFRMFKIAKECGCKFYLGSDAHERHAFDGANQAFSRAIDILDLKEEDKFIL